MNRKHSLNLLKLACVLTALMGVALFFFVAPAVVMDYASHREPRFWIDLIYIWIVGALSFAALGQAWKICVEIGRDNTFSEVNARGLVRISRLMGTACALMAVGLAVLLFGRGQPEPVLEGLTALGALIALVLALFASAMAQLIRAGAALKDENDLTI
ncbi:MAG TPA: DUF2975 domain-containing protein [Candidatus Faecivicinus avistercoris]|nr:DUF2975 domain-containing protein [Candidatus Faecivicinus avistercoris]